MNAIDDDHRDGIWRTLFKDNWLGDKQIIMTCHGQEFIKMIQQGLGAERVKNHCIYYEILPHDGNHHPAVDTSPRTKNYVLNAQDYIARQDSRNALSESRRALESQSQRLWKWISNRISEPVEVKLKKPNEKPELNNLCTQLRKLLNKKHFSHECKASLIEALDALLGVNGNSLEWNYLNSGTHEDDRQEFDRGTVKLIVDAITKIDAALP